MATLKLSIITAAVFSITQSAIAAGLPDVSNTHTGKQLKGADSFTGALTNGKPDLMLRLRYEEVDDDIPAAHALAGTGSADLLSLRAKLGYSTERFHGFYGRIEFEANTRLGDDNALNVDDDLTFPPGPTGSRIAAGHSLIPDNNFEEINEAYIGWRSPTSGCKNAPGGCNGPTTVKLGRQSIIYDNHRWVGNIVWRQNNQSFDALRIDNSSVPGLGISYVYLDEVKRTFGEDSAFRNYEMNDSHLINVSYETPIGKLVGYGYLLDFDDNPRTPFPEGVGAVGTPGIANFDSYTWGLRLTGKHPLNDDFTLLYEAEWANQDPSNDAGPTLSDNNYYNLEVGGAFKLAGKPMVVKVGHEVLEGNGVNAIQTPLATVHAFNGWADKFVGAPGGTATPAGGLKDTSLTVVLKGLLAEQIGPSKLVFQYHDYKADTTVGGVSDYGQEWGLLFAKPIPKNWLLVAKYTNFEDGGDGFSYDTQKLWLMAQYQFQ
ncbi:MAG: alginate export family protein [Chromatiales bacterium]|jgi:hypothetical protein